MRLPLATPPVPQDLSFDVVISQLVGLPATGSTVRSKPTGGSEWQAVVLAEALSTRGFSVAIVGPFFAYALDRGVQYIPDGEVVGRRDAEGRHRPTAKIRARVLVSERFGQLPPGVEFGRVVFDLHDLPDQRLQGVIQAMGEIPDSAVVVHSNFTASLLDGWPRVSVIPCMLPDDFVFCNALTPLTIAVDGAPRRANEGGATSVYPKVNRAPRYVYGSAAMKGLEPTLKLWSELKRTKHPHFKRATLTVTSPGYDAINPKWLEGAKDVEVVTGLSPAGMQQLLADSDGIFMVSTYPETFGIVFHQCELAGKPAHVLQLHKHEDALYETLGRLDTLFTETTPFVDSFGYPSQPWPARDFSVSTILPLWLEVLGLSAGTSEDRSTDRESEGRPPPPCASDVPAAGSTKESA
jgi:hypothetical protein